MGGNGERPGITGLAKWAGLHRPEVNARPGEPVPGAMKEMDHLDTGFSGLASVRDSAADDRNAAIVQTCIQGPAAMW